MKRFNDLFHSTWNFRRLRIRDISSAAQVKRLVVPSILDTELRFARDRERHLADQFVGMYVNDWTIDLDPVGRKAIQTLLDPGGTKQAWFPK